MLKVNENTIKRFLLEILLFEFRNMKFSYATQDIFRSHKFYEYMSYLEANDLINVIKHNHAKTFYTLTDFGRLMALLWIKRSDCPKEYVFLDRKIHYDY